MRCKGIVEWCARGLPYGCVGALGGVASWYTYNRADFLWMLCLVLVCCGIVFWVTHKSSYKQIIWIWFSVAVCSGVFVAHSFEQTHTYQNLPIGYSGIFEGRVDDKPDIRTDKQFVTVTLYCFADETLVPGRASPCPEQYKTGRVRIAVDRYIPVSYGDIVRFSGDIRSPASFLGQNGVLFDYPRYLALNDIVGVTKVTYIEVVGKSEISWVRNTLYQAFDSLTERIHRVLSEPFAGIINGIVLGDKSGIDTETTNAFRVAGVSHLLVLSGFNVTLVAGASKWLFGRFGRRSGFVAAAITCVLFFIMTGGSATVLRATIMVLLALYAESAGRMYGALRAVLYATTIMVILAPRILFDDIGWELSVLATVGLVAGEPILGRFFHWVTARWSIRESLITTLCAIGATLPILIFRMGSISGWALVTNMLVTPIIPWVMYIGIAVLVLSYGFPVLLSVGGFVLYLCAGYIELVASTAYRYSPSSALQNSILLFVTSIGVVGILWFISRMRPQENDSQPPTSSH